ILKKFGNFFKSRIAMVITSLFLLHLIGLIYTTDFAYAYKDLQVKFPLLILLVFISAVLVSTFASMYNYFTIKFNDIREICTFVSHIRLSLFICLAIF